MRLANCSANSLAVLPSVTSTSTPLKEGWAYLIEVEGNDDCTDVSEKTGRPIGTVGKHVMSFVHYQPVRPT